MQHDSLPKLKLTPEEGSSIIVMELKLVKTPLTTEITCSCPSETAKTSAVLLISKM